MPDRVARQVLRKATPLDVDERVGSAVRKLLATGLPALPAVEGDGSYAGVFGAHELLTAFFPGYLEDLCGAAMISSVVDEVLERRFNCTDDPVHDHLNTDHVVVEGNYSDTQLAELFLHHRVHVIPIAVGGRIEAVVPLDAFVRALGGQLLSQCSAAHGGS